MLKVENGKEMERLCVFCIDFVLIRTRAHVAKTQQKHRLLYTVSIMLS